MEQRGLHLRLPRPSPEELTNEAIICVLSTCWCSPSPNRTVLLHNSHKKPPTCLAPLWGLGGTHLHPAFLSQATSRRGRRPGMPPWGPGLLAGGQKLQKLQKQGEEAVAGSAGVPRSRFGSARAWTSNKINDLTSSAHLRAPLSARQRPTWLLPGFVSDMHLSSVLESFVR